MEKTDDMKSQLTLIKRRTRNIDEKKIRCGASTEVPSSGLSAVAKGNPGNPNVDGPLSQIQKMKVSFPKRTLKVSSTNEAATVVKQDGSHRIYHKLASSASNDSVKDEPQTGALPSASITAPLKVLQAVQWSCDECHRICIPIRSESRCLCGHRYKEHKGKQVKKKDGSITTVFPCGNGACNCKHFFFVVAEGAWILRCRCKHKHIDHDSSTFPFKCKKTGCNCSVFDSPWVCNCGHSWANHSQHIVDVIRRDLSDLMCSDPNLIAVAAEAMAQELQPAAAGKTASAAMIMQDTVFHESESSVPFRRDGFS